MVELGVFAIFKNESHVLKEWAEHYIDQGADKIWLVDNNSSDNYQEQVSHLSPDQISISVDNRIHAHLAILRQQFNEIRRECEWLILPDLDEFIYARYKFNRIKDYLRSLDPDVSAVYTPWKLFGSSGYKQQPISVRESFLHRACYPKGALKQGMLDRPNRILTKLIVRCSAVSDIDVHSCSLSTGHPITSDNKPHSGGEFAPVSERVLRKSFLHLNHYAIQSREFFYSVKATRGSVSTERDDNVRGQGYFEAFDTNEMVDVELRNISIKCRRKRKERRAKGLSRVGL